MNLVLLGEKEVVEGEDKCEEVVVSTCALKVPLMTSCLGTKES